MKKNTTIWLLLIALSSIFASCKKETTNIKEEQLPPETQTGAFTFGCKIDGMIYTATGKGGLLADEKVNYSYFSSDSTFDITANGIKAKKFSIHIVFKCFNINTYSSLGTPPLKLLFMTTQMEQFQEVRIHI